MINAHQPIEISTYRRFGVMIYKYQYIGSPKWYVHIRYRTLFTLAMIAWIITLIRLIRSWRRKHGTG